LIMFLYEQGRGKPMLKAPRWVWILLAATGVAAILGSVEFTNPTTFAAVALAGGAALVIGGYKLGFR
jgi:hypothetical protein